MDSTAAKFEQADEDMRSMLSQLMNQLGALQSGWQGGAGRSFEQVKQSYEASQKKMSDALRETAAAIKSSGANYEASDESSSGRVSGINTSVNLNL